MNIDLTHDQILDYREPRDDDVALRMLMKEAAERGHMTRDDLKKVAKWKWRGERTKQLCAENLKADVKKISSVSFAADSELLRVGVLIALRGVGWPMASVILHFTFPKRYPILDKMAMKSVGGSTHYTFKRWCEYTKLCRDTATEHGVSMRTLDKALWADGKNAP